MMDRETFRSTLGRLYRGFDRKPPTEDKVNALYLRIRRFHSHAWEQAVTALLCESTFPSLKDILTECHEASRRMSPEIGAQSGLPSEEECCTPAENEFWSRTFVMAASGKSPRQVAEFAATGLDNPLLSRAYPVIRDAISRWAFMGEHWRDWDATKRAMEQEVVDPQDLASLF
jgi:hypothetical protein